MMVAVYLWLKKKKELQLVHENEALKKQTTAYGSSVLAIENERNRISRELHDQVGSDLLSAKIHLSSLIETDHNQERQGKLGMVQSTILDVMKSVQELSKNLYPQTLDKYGLEFSLNEILQRFKEAGTGIHAQLKFKPFEETKLTAILAYRCVQELFNNALKHSKAKNVNFDIGPDSNGKIIILYRDDGVGFEADAMSKGTGIIGIQNRLRSIGGDFEKLESRSGTEIRIQIPIRYE